MRPARMRRLRAREVFVRAAPTICFEVVASAGRVLERRSADELLVEFATTVDGERIVTVELVRLHRPERIEYRWIEGPLPAVEETIHVVPHRDGARLRYEGRFAVEAPWIARPFVRRWVRKRFARSVREHLDEAKRIAEARAQRSRLHPHTSEAGDCEGGRRAASS